MEDVIQKLKGHSTQAVRECITKGENGWKNLSLFSLIYFFIRSVTGNEKNQKWNTAGKIRSIENE
jgi:hypothetical protein